MNIERAVMKAQKCVLGTVMLHFLLPTVCNTLRFSCKVFSI